MRRLHRNSQKRYYESDAVYFITAVTHGRHPYFGEPVLAELFIRNLWFAKRLKQCELYGYTVLPDHVHVLLQPTGTANISEVMRSLKTNFSRDANDIILNRIDRIPLAGDVAPRRLQPHEQHMREVLPALHQRFLRTHGAGHDVPAFKWQKSFRDHVIRNNADYDRHIEYIRDNALKHQLADDAEDWQHLWVDGMPEPIFR